MKSLYDQTYKIGEDIKNLGYDYTDKILRRSLSRYIYTFPHLANFLDSLDVAVTHLYNSVKAVKNHYNFTVKKDETKTN
jgi:hypothetical protein